MNAIAEFLQGSQDVFGKPVEFQNTEELHKIPFVRKWSEMPRFSHFEKSGSNLWARFLEGKSELVGEILCPESVEIRRADYFHDR